MHRQVDSREQKKARKHPKKPQKFASRSPASAVKAERKPVKFISFSMSLSVSEPKWTEVYVKHSCYVGPGSTQNVVLQCDSNDALVAFLGEKKLDASCGLLAYNRSGHIVPFCCQQRQNHTQSFEG